MPSRKGFTFIELSLVIAVIAVLLPLSAQARDRARQTACMANARQFAMSIAMYVQDWEARMFFSFNRTGHPGYGWMQMILPCMRTAEAHHCPSASRRPPLHVEPLDLIYRASALWNGRGAPEP